jgi:FkbM family methyltransferase
MTAVALFRRSGHHPATKVAIELAIGLMCRVVGRRNAARAAQFALKCARLDQFGANMRANGEVALMGWALDVVPEGRRVRVVDVGAYVGAWSRSLLATAESRGRMDQIDLHAFEASRSSFEKLVKALGNRSVSLQQIALSDQPGTATLHITLPACNSFYEIPRDNCSPTRETVAKITVDTYARQARLDRIDILKIDTEGHDLAVLNGACGMLRQGRIGVVQFEYNHCWIYARHFLRDAFDLLTPLGYRLGKLTPRGVMFCPSWDEELETFIHAQYVACSKDIAERLPRVDWWRSAAANKAGKKP